MARLRGGKGWRVMLPIISEGVEGGLAGEADGAIAHEAHTAGAGSSSL